MNDEVSKPSVPNNIASIKNKLINNALTNRKSEFNIITQLVNFIMNASTRKSNVQQNIYTQKIREIFTNQISIQQTDIPKKKNNQHSFS